MRGKDQNLVPFLNPPRITPAYAGKSPETYPAAVRSEDHPRLCGEKVQTASGIAPMMGSPPPMRGKAASNRVDMDSAGITPAYAGKRCGTTRLPLLLRDHPRLCGEKLWFLLLLLWLLGSPPPMRGKVENVRLYGLSMRITPAYAGKSQCWY